MNKKLYTSLNTCWGKFFLSKGQIVENLTKNYKYLQVQLFKNYQTKWSMHVIYYFFQSLSLLWDNCLFTEFHVCLFIFGFFSSEHLLGIVVYSGLQRSVLDKKRSIEFLTELTTGCQKLCINLKQSFCKIEVIKNCQQPKNLQLS